MQAWMYASFNRVSFLELDVCAQIEDLYNHLAVEMALL